jgi:predicted metal-binding membrane protein
MTAYASRLGPLARTRGVVLGGLLGMAVVGWVITDRRMSGMDAGPGTDLGALGFYTSAWVVMMAAMMFPSIAPMVLTYRMVERRRRELPRAVRRGSISLFVAGYLASWTAFGLLAYALFDGVRSLSIGAFSWHRGGPYLAGAVLLAAAVYQLTPAKDACLRRCRSPLQFLTSAWRDGPLGAFRMGVEHGGWCVGCCWGLMAALFALGVMSVSWMILVAGVVAVEKLLPSKTLANRSTAIVLVGLGLGVAFAPRHVPGLTLPDSPAAMRAMRSMSGAMHAMPATMHQTPATTHPTPATTHPTPATMHHMSRIQGATAMGSPKRPMP